MAVPAIVAILGAAAESYSRQLATTVGEGIVETLLNQGKIARNLDEIKSELAALSEYIRTKLPVVIERAVDASLARKLEFDVAEKALSVKSSIATLRQARKDNASAEAVRFMVSELIRHADECFEAGGVLISYGQPYYASVGIAFGAGLNAYAEAVTFEPARAAGMRSRALDWQSRLHPWVDATRPASLMSAMNWVEARYQLGLQQLPSIETWKGNPTREFAISWQKQPSGVTQVFGAWFGLFPGEKGVQGDTIATVLPAGATFDQAVAAGALRFAVPVWFTVKADVPASMADYNLCVDQLVKLVVDYYNYPAVAPAARNAVAVVNDILKSADAVLREVKDDDLTIAALLATTSHSDEERHQAVEATLRSNRPGFAVIPRL